MYLNSYTGLVCVTCPSLPIVMLRLSLLGYLNGVKESLSELASVHVPIFLQASLKASLHSNTKTSPPQDPAQLSFRESLLPFGTK